ncbi:hypothetical protein Gotur_031290 [Gossypium turneri]
MVKARLKYKNGPCISWCLYKHFPQVFVPSTWLIEEFLENEWPPNQSIEE